MCYTMIYMDKLFRAAAHRTAEAIGSPKGFAGAVFIVIVWALTGPLFGFSDTWQLVINTGTTIVTFLTVFLIQNTQNRDTRALHLKLDELIRSQVTARNQLVALEDMSDVELDNLQKQFESVQHHAQQRRVRRQEHHQPPQPQA